MLRMAPRTSSLYWNCFTSSLRFEGSVEPSMRMKVAFCLARARFGHQLLRSCHSPMSCHDMYYATNRST